MAQSLLMLDAVEILYPLAFLHITLILDTPVRAKFCFFRSIAHELLVSHITARSKQHHTSGNQ